MQAETSKRLRENIEAIIKQRRFSKYEVAQEAGIHYDTLRKFLSARSDMTVSKVESIADVLGMTVTGLINWRAPK